MDKKERDSIYRLVPKLVFVSVIICGCILWVVWADMCQKQMIWIPEMSRWERIAVYMIESWYIPLIFGIVAIVSLVVLQSRYGEKKL